MTEVKKTIALTVEGEALEGNLVYRDEVFTVILVDGNSVVTRVKSTGKVVEFIKDDVTMVEVGGKFTTDANSKVSYQAPEVKPTIAGSFNTPLFR